MDNDFILVQKSLEEKEEKGKIDEKNEKKNSDACSIDMCMKEKKIAKIVHENPICKEVHVSCEEQVDKSPLSISNEENANGNVYLAST